MRNGFWALGVLAMAVACGSDDTSTGTTGGSDAGGAAGTTADGSAASAGLGGGGGSDGGTPDATAGAAGAPDAAGSDAQADAAGDAASCGPNVPFFAPVQCVSCVETSCCDQKAACGDEPDCIALRACGGKPRCSTGSCWLDCIKSHEKGYLVASVFHSCLSKNCQSSCGGTPNNCGFSLAPTPAGCAPCLESKCCAEIYAASQTPEYWQHDYCRLSQCPTYEPSCLATCANQNPAGAAAAQPLQTCAADQCASECGL